MSQVVSINSGFQVSTGFILDRADHAFSIGIPLSFTAAGVQLQFAAFPPTIATSADYWTLGRSDATGLPYVVASGPGPSMSAPITAPTQFMRIRTLVNMGVQVDSLLIVPMQQFG